MSPGAPRLAIEYLIDLERWILGEIEAKNIITQRLSAPICPSQYENMTAKQLFDTVASTRQETATAPFAIALERILGLRFESTADSYIDQFLVSYQAANNAADGMQTQSPDREYHIGSSIASAMLVMGTRRTGLQPQISLIYQNLGPGPKSFLDRYSSDSGYFNFESLAVARDVLDVS
ncbi:hypothetical protein K3495_g7281 [Podosphaera aphanis]|nr:hypothetical protein K3495_g7281 [Podosphaera aphanis]